MSIETQEMEIENVGVESKRETAERFNTEGDGAGGLRAERKTDAGSAVRTGIDHGVTAEGLRVMMGRTAKAWLVRAGVLSIALLTFIAPSSAAELASGDQIQAAIIGNSLEGIWTDNSRFAEYYDPNGTFRGYAFAPHRTKYAGTWMITGNQMCTRWTLVETGASYHECYQYVVGAGTVSLYRKGRSIGVTATVKPGNPNRY